jgi:hypothetical protein
MSNLIFKKWVLGTLYDVLNYKPIFNLPDNDLKWLSYLVAADLLLFHGFKREIDLLNKSFGI